MLFLQGTRDALAQVGELEPLCQVLGALATLKLFPDADHSFHVPARSGRTDAQVLAGMLDALAAWVAGLEEGGASRSTLLQPESAERGKVDRF
jgi:hypothetical protein